MRAHPEAVKTIDQVAVTLRPGYESHPGMDVDMVIIHHPSGRTEYYFISGTRKDKTEIGDMYYIDRRGNIAGPRNMGRGHDIVMQIDRAGIAFKHDIWGFPHGMWMNAITKALGRPTPKDRLGSLSPCYMPGLHPFQRFRS